MKPILFNTEMVRAILSGRKTVTRRVIKLNDNTLDFLGYTVAPPDLYGTAGFGRGYYQKESAQPKYLCGEILYVRETYAIHNCAENECIMLEYSDCNGCLHTKDGYCYAYKASHEYDVSVKLWRPSIHMPKEAARIFIKVTDVRVERLQDITVEQVEKEGLTPILNPLIYEDKSTALRVCHQDFSELWNSTIKKQDVDKYGWDANPWVWVYEFEVQEVKK